jgi:hypothetical protein
VGEGAVVLGVCGVEGGEGALGVGEAGSVGGLGALGVDDGGLGGSVATEDIIGVDALGIVVGRLLRSDGWS